MLYAQKKLESADITLSDLHTLLVQSQQDEAKELTMLPSVYVKDPLPEDKHQYQ